MEEKQVSAQAFIDANEALTKYGGALQVRRLGHPLFGQEVTVSRVHLVYDAEMVANETRDVIQKALNKTRIKVHFHAR